MQKHHLHGWKKDKHDPRDYLYFKALPVLGENALPRRTDFTPQCSAVEQQGGVGSCIANGVVGALEYIDRARLTSKFMWLFKRFRDLSRLFVYYNTRVAEGTVDEDSGGTIREAIKAVATFGVCYEKTWPYSETAWIKKPTPACYKEALPFELKGYYRAQTKAEMLNGLAQGHPIAFGMRLYEGFETVGKDGMVPMPKPGEPVIGKHALLMVGYDLDGRYFIVRNSWGKEWGMGGYCKLPFGYCTIGERVDDCWVIER